MGSPVHSAGWYPDHDGSASLRWWDGSQWTPHTHPPTPPLIAAAPIYAGPPRTVTTLESRHARNAGLCIVVGLLIPFVWIGAMVFGIMGLVEIHRSPVPIKGRGSCIAGIVFPVAIIIIVGIVIATSTPSSSVTEAPASTPYTAPSDQVGAPAAPATI